MEGYFKDDIAFDSEEEALSIIGKINNLFIKKGRVTMYDLKTLLNLTPRGYEDTIIGWIDVKEFRVRSNFCFEDEYDSLGYHHRYRIPSLFYLYVPEPVSLEPELPELKMSPERFKELLDELDGNSLQTLKEKNARYAQNGDCLHNFRSGADIAGGTPAQACWGYLTKHLVALRDMVERDDFSNREDFLEKCQDTINYIRFLWCIGNDKTDKEKESN